MDETTQSPVGAGQDCLFEKRGSTKSLTEDERVAHFWREVAYQALRDVNLSHEATAEERVTAREWIFAEDDVLLSFWWVCKKAGLDVAAVRAEVKDP